jgi:hypothetical protein
VQACGGGYLAEGLQVPRMRLCPDHLARGRLVGSDGSYIHVDHGAFLLLLLFCVMTYMSIRKLLELLLLGLALSII